MSRRGLAAGGAGMVAVLLLGTLLAVPRPGADASALAADSRGWLAARRYLERRGAAVTLADVPLDAATPGAETWVLAFPWQGRLAEGEIEALGAHLRAGGTVLLAYSRTLDQHQEEAVLAALGLGSTELKPPPLAPWRWWTYQRRRWSLEPGDGWDGAAPELAVPARRSAPVPPAGAAVLYRYRDAGVDLPLIFSYSFHRGRVVALPADVLANGYLPSTGHADLLDALRRWLGDAWRFDEYHHGLVDPRRVAAAGASTLAWDLFMLHLAVFYVLGFLGLARRFGSPWREAAAAAGLTAAYLRRLGALHRELGHHRAAARLLAERTRELDPTLPPASVPVITTDAELVRFARKLTRRQGASS